ncbi:hypothetical protein [Subtercola sp. Z020]|uniref:hypothetical protein n=1 Tax=Subtercola sp. Z020 TaxID=2080582 RepID=UPI00130E473D|nr:hypothetical protein [Subtercola sp. Z020]
MEPLLIVAIVLACLVGWVIVSLTAAFIFGRVIGRADDERRAKRSARSRSAAYGSRSARTARSVVEVVGARDAGPPSPETGRRDAPLWGAPPTFTQSGVLTDQVPPERATLR